MAWNSIGTVTVTNGSKTLTGVGTNWIKQASGWQVWIRGEERPHEIEEVVSSTHLKLVKPIERQAASGLDFVIVPTQGLNVIVRDKLDQVFAQLASAQEGWEAVVSNFSATTYQLWLDQGNSGTVADFLDFLVGPRGPQGKSAYDVWIDEGNVGTAADFLDDVSSGAVTATAANVSAAQAAQAAAEAAETGAEAARDITIAARDVTTVARDVTTAARDAAQTAETNAAAARAATETARDATLAARDITTAARDMATTARDTVLASEAQVAADLAAVAQIFDTFDDRYLGPFATVDEPTTDNDGDPLIVGAIYWNTDEGELRFWNSTAWESPEATVSLAAQQALAARDVTTAARDVTTAARGVATAARDDAQTAQAASETARDQSQTAQTAAEAAQAAAEAAETEAQLHAQSASLSSNADQWVSEGNYVLGQLSWSIIDLQTYRSKTNHSGLNTDPSLDTTNWGLANAAGEGAMVKSIYDPQNIEGDAFARANHTGTQAISTVTGLHAALDGKAPTAHDHTKSDISDFSDADYATAAQGALADTAVQPADIGTAAPLNVAVTGDAAAGEVVKGDDTRLSDSRAPTAHHHAKSDIIDFDDADYATSAQGAAADTALQPGDAIELTAPNGSAAIPAGTEAQRDGSPSAGYLRFNSDAGSFEGYNGSEWGAIGGAGGGSSVALDGPISAYATQQKTYTITDYSAFSTYAVSASLGTATISGDTISYTAPASDGTDTLTVTRDGVDVAFSITVLPAGVTTPTNVSPANGATDQGGSVTLQSSAFAWFGFSDTHASSDWQLATDAGFSNIVASATADAANRTSWQVTDLATSQTYYWRVRHRGANNGTSEWSTGTSFTTAASFGGLIGVAGGQGFGVGEYPGALPAGFSNLAGNTDPANANYGNYQYSDGSIMVFVPRFYYRIGAASSPRFATYGANAIDIAGVDTYDDEAAANAAGFAMHRAFIDGGSVKSGFFIDKYLCSKNAANNAGRSVQNGVPISLTTSTSYTRSGDMTGCTGILADGVILSRARGAGMNVASAFMYSALWLLSLAHGQAATSATTCAWYDAGGTTNFPKGCNNNALGDVNDGALSFTTAGDGATGKPRTGSANDLAKTAHNGQSCGVVDLNGAMWEMQLGITSPGSNATDSAQISSGDVYVLKESSALGDLTAGYGGATDAWGNATHLATLYDAEAGLMVWGSTTGSIKLGSGTNQVLDGAVGGQGYQRTAVGLPMATSSYDPAGTNLFGLDDQFRYNRANLCPVAGGNWSDAASAGVGARDWNSHRSNVYAGIGFRASAYGS